LEKTGKPLSQFMATHAADGVLHGMLKHPCLFPAVLHSISIAQARVFKTTPKSHPFYFKKAHLKKKQ